MARCAFCFENISFPKGEPIVFYDHVKMCNRSKLREKRKVAETKAKERKKDVPETKFFCEICGRQCKTKQSLAVHISGMHGERKYKCQECEFTAKTIKSLET